MSEHNLQYTVTDHNKNTGAVDFESTGIKADVVAESTSAAGVTIDGVLCKDNAVTASGGFTGAITGNVTGDLAGNVTGNIDGAATLDTLTLDVGLVNSAGNNIANATAITKPFTVIAAANNAVGAILPVAAAGKVIIIKNSAANGALVYPQVNSAINALGANNAIEIATTAAAMFIAYNSTLWYTVPVLPS